MYEERHGGSTRTRGRRTDQATRKAKRRNPNEANGARQKSERSNNGKHILGLIRCSLVLVVQMAPLLWFFSFAASLPAGCLYTKKNKEQKRGSSHDDRKKD